MIKEHFILSNYLRASKTFSIYQDAFALLSLEESYLPMEINTHKKISSH